MKNRTDDDGIDAASWLALGRIERQKAEAKVYEASYDNGTTERITAACRESAYSAALKFADDDLKTLISLQRLVSGLVE